MAALHATLGWLVAVTVAGVVVAALPTALERSRSYRWLDRFVIAQFALTVLTALAGLVLLAGSPLRDALHLLYGGIVVALPISVRLAAQGRPARTVGRWVAIAGLVALGATLRSFMTGS